MAELPGGSGAADEVVVIVADEQDDVEVDLDRWSALARAVLVDEGLVGELTLTFVDRDDIAALNAEHMGVQGPTDVLSFPLDADLDPSDAPVAGVPLLLGDVVICPAVAADAAPTHAGSLDDELALLVVHGVLHVLGHDHTGSDDTEQMQARELHHLEGWHWRGPRPAGFALTHADHGHPDH
ncbi:MAG: rRNA maturation RNase YbeY [Ilumatobacter sp.]|nr:MAG: rRNA maturation RNase YbeY [Ilumatobacter sp.]